MPTSQEEQEDTLLFSLQSSLRNALHTFGASSTQYRSIRMMVDEETLRMARMRAERERVGDGAGTGTGSRREEGGVGEAGLRVELVVRTRGA